MKWHVTVPTGSVTIPGMGTSQVNHGYNVSAATRDEAANEALARHWSEAPGSPRKGRLRVERIMRYEVTFPNRHDRRRRETFITDMVESSSEIGVAKQAYWQAARKKG